MRTKFICLLSLIASLSALFAQDLPVEIQADLLLTKVKKSIDKNDWAGAAKNLKNLKALDVELPDEFHYNYGRALDKAGNHAESLKEILIYLHKSGGAGKYEKEAMEVFLGAKNARLPAAPVQFPKGMVLARQGALLAASVQDNSAAERAEHTVSDCRQLEAMDVELPADFQFLYGRALLSAKQYKPARERLTAYFKESGREAPHYQEALKLFLSLDELEKQAAHEAMLREEQEKVLAAAREQLRGQRGKGRQLTGLFQDD